MLLQTRSGTSTALESIHYWYVPLWIYLILTRSSHRHISPDTSPNRLYHRVFCPPGHRPSSSLSYPTVISVAFWGSLCLFPIRDYWEASTCMAREPPPTPHVTTMVSSSAPLPRNPALLYIIQRLDIEPPSVTPYPAWERWISILSESTIPSTPFLPPVSSMLCLCFSAPSYPWYDLKILHGSPTTS